MGRGKEATQFKKGKSGNPGGRPKLPEEVKAMKEASLEKAIVILYDKLHSKVFLKKVRNSDLIKFLETAFDRFGLPKVTKNELTGDNGAPLLPPSIIFTDKEIPQVQPAEGAGCPFPAPSSQESTSATQEGGQ